ncbi:MAG: DUF3035 domain-containing protein [Holosporaceae bacterium]
MFCSFFSLFVMLFSTTLLVLGLGGCDTTRETLGLKKKAPDEFAAAPYEKGLEVPPHMSQLPKPAADAAAKPSKEAQIASAEKPSSLSKGEEAFLNELKSQKKT